jgi:ABC-type multidrug transport system fused ATPase/permease subunit
MAFLNYFLWRKNRDHLRQSRRDLSAIRSPSIAHFAETAQGATTVRTFNREASFSQRFYSLDQSYLDQKLKTIGALIRYSVKMNSLTALLLLVTGVSAYYWLNNGWISIGSLGVALGFITLSGMTVQMFFEWMAQFEEALVGMERLDQYLRTPIEPRAYLPASSKVDTQQPRYTKEQELQSQSARLYDNSSMPNSVPRSLGVVLKNVWFRYQPELPFVLKGLHFEIKAGERLGIIGRTGSGKSSLIQALFYLYPLSEGEIEVGGKSPMANDLVGKNRLVNLEVYRREMSFISQESVLFRGTLRENLDLPGQMQDSSLIEALERVGLNELANKEGLNLQVEERGRNLSLGEKQLVCMARCLLQDAPIVIMDEATSSVDPQSEEILVRATDEFFTGRTQIIIAHRLSTLKKCDRILWLDQGEIRMVGSPDSVLQAFENQ